jgi:hypothetical protein
MTSPQLLSLESRPVELFRQIHGVSIRDRVLVYKLIQKILLCDSGPMLISKNLVTLAKAGAYADLDPGLRREDKMGRCTE